MTAVPLGLSEYVRNLGATPRVILKNLFVEKDPSNLVDGMSRLQRPGMVPFVSIGQGPIRGVFRQKGAFDDDYLAVSGLKLYRITPGGTATGVGQVIANDRVQFASSQTRCLIATGAKCYSYDGTTVTTVKMPSDEPIGSVTFLDGYFILAVQDSQHWFWIAPGQTDPDPLSFASAENSPDNISRVERLGDELIFFGEGNSTEVWIPTGNANLPFQRVEGRLYEQGCANRDTVAKLDNTLFWVGSDTKVYRLADVPTRISDNSIEELLYETSKSDLRAWAFEFQGHTFYCLTMGQNGTRVYDVSTGVWIEFASYGRPAWRAHMGAQITGKQIIAGDDERGILWSLDPTVANDNGKPMVREIMGGVAVIGTALACNNLQLVCALGRGNAVPPGFDPALELRWSDDAGNTWTVWKQIKLGKVGQYSQQVLVNRLGMMKAPGRLFHFRCSEDILLRISYCRINEGSAA